MTAALAPGTTVKEIATRDALFTSPTVLESDPIGILFEVRRIVTEGGDVQEVTSRILVPWSNVRHIVLLEERK